MAPVLYQCHLLTASMMHFVHQMQYYITFEVGLVCCYLFCDMSSVMIYVTGSWVWMGWLRESSRSSSWSRSGHFGSHHVFRQHHIKSSSSSIISGSNVLFYILYLSLRFVDYDYLVCVDIAASVADGFWSYCAISTRPGRRVHDGSGRAQAQGWVAAGHRSTWG